MATRRYTLCIIAVALLFVGSARCDRLYFPPDFLESINCTSLLGSTFDPSQAVSPKWNLDTFASFVAQEIEGIQSYVPWYWCQDSVQRLACYTALQHLGIGTIDVSVRYPFLSYAPNPTINLFSTSHQPTPADPVRIAYILLFHKDLEQSLRLLNAIYSEKNLYLIHVDAKNPTLREQLFEYAASRYSGNVALMDKPFTIEWGGIQMVYATMEAIFQLLDAGKWDFVINLSGSDYPLCTTSELERFLGSYLGQNFDPAVESWGNKIQTRMYESYVYCGENFLLSHRERPFFNNPPSANPLTKSYTMSQWFIYSREFAEYLREGSFPRNLLAQYEHSFVPDEGYFSTVLLNSRFRSTRIPHNLRYLEWEPILQAHPLVWTYEKMATVLRQVGPPTAAAVEYVTNFSPNPFYPTPPYSSCFLRKVDLAVDRTIFDALDKMLLEKDS